MAETISGTIERVVYHNPENSFCVLRVKARERRDLATVVGPLPNPSPGEFLDAEGEWVINKEHGEEFRAGTMRSSRPSTMEGIEKYLGSGMIRGIGPVYAKKLVLAFGERVFEVIENNPKRLLKVEGIGPARKEMIISAWLDQKAVREIMVFLQSHGVGTLRAARIYKTYGNEAIRIVRENPYQLAQDIRGLGFKSADQIARNLGIDSQSMSRARAGVCYVLQELTSDGHSAYPLEGVVEKSSTLLDVPADIAREAIRLEEQEKRLVRETPGGQELVYLAPLYLAEAGLAETLTALKHGTHPLPPVHSEKAIEWVQKQEDLQLAEGQKKAIRKALTDKLLVITGGPGVGKTTLINCILAIFGAKGLRSVLCAPTGRAAKRLAESTGREAKTIHRLLEFDPATGDFKRNRERPLKGDVFVIDECSMVDLVLMHKLVRAIPPKAAVLFVGDVDQLPSVGPGSVLADLISSGTLEVTVLTEIFRQAAESRIVITAHQINRGEFPETRIRDRESDFYFFEEERPEAILETMISLVSERIPAKFGFDRLRDIQVLAPMNRALLGTRTLNLELQNRLNPGRGGPEIERYGWTFRVGDRVMQIENDYDKDVFNGDIGTVKNIHPEEQTLTVDFDNRPVEYGWADLDELVLAYAITIHKSQGSEYPAVLIPLHTQHYVMLRKNLVYTALTRGKKLVVMVGQRKALSIALQHGEKQKRYGALRHRLTTQTAQLPTSTQSEPDLFSL